MGSTSAIVDNTTIFPSETHSKDYVNNEVSNPLILIIDDDADMRFLLRQMMEQEHYRIAEADSGEEGLALFTKIQPDMVLLDGLLPTMDGFAVCARIQTLPGGNRVPVLIVTGLNDADSVNEAFKAGATDYITKPINRAVLRHRVKRLLHTREAEEVLRLRERALAATSNGIMITDPHRAGNPIIYVNMAFTKLTGYDEAQVVGHSWTFLAGPETDMTKLDQAVVAAQETQVTLKHYRQNGSWFWDELSVYPVYDASEQLSHFVGVMHDVTERKQAEEELYRVNQQLTAQISELNQRTQEISLLSEMGALFQACRRTEEGYGVVAQMSPQLFPKESGALFIKTAGQILSQESSWGMTGPAMAQSFKPDECWALRRGRIHVIEDIQRGLICKHVQEGLVPASYICVPMIAQGESVGVLHLSTVQADSSLPHSKQQLALTVAEQIGMAMANLKLQETLQNQSVRDPLTGLFNRRYLEEALEREVRRVNRNGRTFGVIMLDIDHFKLFNDNYGHEAGDRVLKAVADFIQANIRGEDFACRYGGEEFIVVMPEISTENALQRAEAMRQNVKQLLVSSNGQHLDLITLSAGVALYPDQGQTAEDTIRAADAALYRAKQQGRDQVVLGN